MDGEMPAVGSAKCRKRAIGRGLRVLLPAAVLGALAILIFFFPVREHLLDLLQWAKSQGSWGPVVMALSFVVATVIPIPGSILAMGAGFLYGPLIGGTAASIGSTIGAAFAFFLGRTIARDWVSEKMSQNQMLASLDEAVGTTGFKTVLLLRLSSIFPFAFLSYAFGLTRASFGQHALASWIGMLPVTMAYAYLGSVAGTLAEVAAGRMQGSHARQVLLWIGLAGVSVAVVTLSQIARRAFKISAANRTRGAARLAPDVDAPRFPADVIRSIEKEEIQG